jgi:crotonobetainyl-CoA:carnitine CoA-transferase CaiB-like acyl-CoA transferase
MWGMSLANAPSAPTPADNPALPLAGLRVVEFTHMVMGPTCGMVLADLGAEVIKVEPIEGDRTRFLLGAGAGFFPLFNRNKKSIAIDLHPARGREAGAAAGGTADVVAENFKPGTMKKYGLDYASLSATNPRLIYVSHKGFLPGPYEHRTALDEVVQMMGGLAYMTGDPATRCARAPASTTSWAACSAPSACWPRSSSAASPAKGQEVQSALFENNVFLVGQHMLQYAMTGQPAAPMPARISPWGIYDVFTVKDGEQIFLSAVSDAQWATFCDALGFADLRDDPRYANNNAARAERPTLLPVLRERLAAWPAADLAALFERVGLPFAPIRKPEELLDDEHLLATGGLADITLPDGPRAGQTAKATLLPFTLGGQRLGVHRDPPKLGPDATSDLLGLNWASARPSRSACARRAPSRDLIRQPAPPWTSSSRSKPSCRWPPAAA